MKIDILENKKLEEITSWHDAIGPIVGRLLLRARIVSSMPDHIGKELSRSNNQRT